MFEPVPELSPDLEWMLQSGRVSQKALLNALLQEHFSSVYQLALVFFNDPRRALEATKRVFSACLLETPHYHGETGVKAWLLTITLNRLQKMINEPSIFSTEESGDEASQIDYLPENAIDRGLRELELSLTIQGRLWAALLFALELDNGLVSQLLPEDTDTIEMRKQELSKLWRTLRSSEVGDQSISEEPFYHWLKESCQRLWPVIELSANNLEKISDDILQVTLKEKSRRKKTLTLFEFLGVGLAVFLAVVLLGGYTSFLPGRVTPSYELAQATSKRPLGSGTPTVTPLPQDVYYHVRPGEKAENIAAKLNVSVQELFKLNRLPAGSWLRPGQALLIPGKIITSTPFPTQPITPMPTFPPLTEDSSLQEIQTRMASFWANYGSHWIDTRVALYGPRAYHGPPQTYRMQFWIGPGSGLILAGADLDGPDYVFLFSDDIIYIARPGDQRPWFIPVDTDEQMAEFNRLLLLYEIVFRGMVINSETDDIHYQIVGSETIGDRETLVLTMEGAWDYTGKLWVDKNSGMVIREQDFELGQDGWFINESLITSFSNNTPPPQDLMDPALPWRGGYAFDETGQPKPVDFQPTPWVSWEGQALLPSQPAPADLKLESSELSFQSNHPINLFNASTIDEWDIVSVFADGYLLGRIQLPNPAYINCTRSPDGKKIAFAPASGYGGYDYEGIQIPYLRWLEFPASGIFNVSGSSLQAYEFAYSPDSKLLAIFGREETDEMRKIYILNTEDGSKQMIYASSPSVYSLTWSPDGKELAWLMPFMDPSHNGGTIAVMRLSDKKFIYSGNLNNFDHPLPTGTPPPDWLAEEWGVSIPAEMGDLDDCAKPPGVFP